VVNVLDEQGKHVQQDGTSEEVETNVKLGKYFGNGTENGVQILWVVVLAT
jgi:hypothetical protein